MDEENWRHAATEERLAAGSRNYGHPIHGPRPSFVLLSMKERALLPPVPFRIESRRCAVASAGFEAEPFGTAVSIEEGARAFRWDGRIVQEKATQKKGCQCNSSFHGANIFVQWRVRVTMVKYPIISPR